MKQTITIKIETDSTEDEMFEKVKKLCLENFINLESFEIFGKDKTLRWNNEKK